MRELPIGTVTFLFTDVEGSTRLIEEVGENGYVEALAEHRRLLRGAFSAHGGVEVDTQGDAFLYAFPDAAEALAAAADAQVALASGPVKVRIGLHTGETRLSGEGYAGRELHRAARIAASGHGGQVVISAATRALVEAELTELGEHRLKDFDEPIPLFQLGDASFPPLKTISNTNLPRPASSFVGRERELTELVSMVSDGTRLLTLSGPGGSGKTRLAIEAASELVPAFMAGVFWVGLAAVRDPALVSETIAQVLGAKDGLAGHIQERELLLLLDNLEQVVDAAPELSQLLEDCPNLKLMVTSRELLRITGEVEYRVPPLEEPEAVELFCERSRLQPDETIAELCRRLDDLPLAIELAAARTSVLSPGQILERLSQRLDLLKGGRDADARQQTLRATIEWSHELLDDRERDLFARLAVFRGGCTLEAAEEVAEADLDVLQSLVEKSLLRHGGERFWMLETIHQYARDRLAEAGEGPELSRKHAAFFLQSAEEVARRAREGTAPLSERLAHVAEQHDNMLAALEWARDFGADGVLLRLAAALVDFWGYRGFSREAEVWTALALERGSSPTSARLRLLRRAAGRAIREGDLALAEQRMSEWRREADQTDDVIELVGGLNIVGMIATEKGDFGTARAAWLEAMQIAAEAGNLERQSAAAINLGVLALRIGDYRAALQHASDAVELTRGLRDESGLFTALLNCGWSSLGLRDAAAAGASFSEAIGIAGQLESVLFIADGATGLGAALVAGHEAERGAQLLGAAASLYAELDEGPNDVDEERARDQAIVDATTTLGAELFSAAWERGSSMTAVEVVEFGCTRTR